MKLGRWKHTHTPNLTFCDKYVDMREGDTLFLIFPIKITVCTVSYSCHGNHISQILGQVAVLKRGDVDLHIHTTFVFICDQYCRNGRGCVPFLRFFAICLQNYSYTWLHTGLHISHTLVTHNT